jgi:anaerobic ribonucleoside-triphosphate reductase activating protein
MRVAGMIKDSVVNGIGIRDVLFLQGCSHHCKGCHNPETWKIDGGTEYSIKQLINEFKGDNDVTISGGEPLEQFTDVWEFMGKLNKKSGKRFWLYTGYSYEEIPQFMLAVLSEYVDVLVDGKFIESQKDLRLPFRGSANQRLIDLPKSIEQNKIVEWEMI